MNYYHIACKYVVPLYRIFYNYSIAGAENLRQAADNGRVVVCTTHSSDLGGMIVGMAVSSVLNTDPYIVVNNKFRQNPLTDFFLRNMNIIWIMGNDMLGNYPALKKIRDLIITGKAKAIIIAPQGVYNKPIPEHIEFRQGFAIPCIQAARTGVTINVVPAIDIGATYRGIQTPGRRIAVVFGHPIEVNRNSKRTELTRIVERSVKELMTANISLFGACFLFAYIYAHC